jgi:site-specific recombinase XerD
VLPGSAVAALTSHRKAQEVFREQFGAVYRTDLDLIFAEPDGTPLKPNSISSSVSLLFQRLKIAKPKGAALHLFRHSHGSHLLAAGMELPAVSERLGHSSVMVTATVYSHRGSRGGIKKLRRGGTNFSGHTISRCQNNEMCDPV